MGLENYRGSKTDEQKMREDQDWLDKTESVSIMLEDTDIIDRYKENYNLVGKIIEKFLGVFLKKIDVTNSLMQSIKLYEQSFIEFNLRNDKNSKLLLQTRESSVEMDIIRTFTNKNIEITEEQEDEFQDGIDSFMEELKKALLEKHGFSENGGK